MDQQLSDLSIVEGGTLNFLPLVAVDIALRCSPESVRILRWPLPLKQWAGAYWEAFHAFKIPGAYDD